MSLGILGISGETKKHVSSTTTVLRRSQRALSGCVRHDAGKHTPPTLSTRSVQDAGVPLLRLGEKEMRRTPRERAAAHQLLRRDQTIQLGRGGGWTRQKNKAPARSRRKNTGPAIRAREKKHRGNNKSQRKSTTRSNTNSRVAGNHACSLTKSSNTTTTHPGSQSTKFPAPRRLMACAHQPLTGVRYSTRARRA